MYARRRLAAILAADLAGYSRFMELDEERTLARIKGLKAEVVNPQITEYRGRLVKTTGDGLLADFESAVDALNCACEIQRIVGERNAALLSDDRLEFRIGINVGEIIAEDGDIFGDSVNVAARLEGLAEPGGICLAAHVREYLVGRPEFIFEDLGEQFLKNIQRPIRVLRVRADALPRSRTGTLRQHNW